MQQTSLTALVDEQMQRAATAPDGRASTTVYGGHEHDLRQTVIVLIAGQALDEHVNPGEATLHVLRGAVRLRTDDATVEASAGDLVVVPDCVHSVDAVQDSALLLTVCKGTYGPA